MKCDDGVGNLSAIYLEGFLGINKVEPRLVVVFILIRILFILWRYLVMEGLLKRRALYLRSIGIILQVRLVIDDTFIGLLNDFYERYYEENAKMFDLLYKVSIEEFEKYSEERCNKLLSKYLYDFTNEDKAIKLFDDIGFENVNNISELACKFCEYYYEILDINNSKILIRS